MCVVNKPKSRYFNLVLLSETHLQWASNLKNNGFIVCTFTRSKGMPELKTLYSS